MEWPARPPLVGGGGVSTKIILFKKKKNYQYQSDMFLNFKFFLSYNYI